MVREIGMRQRVYPGMIQKGTLHPDHAKRQLERITTAAKILELMTDKEFEEILKRGDKVEIKQQSLF